MSLSLSLCQYMDEDGMFTADDLGDEDWEEPPEDEAAGKDEL